MTKTNKANESSLTKTIEDALHRAEQIEVSARDECKQLERALRLARGTGDVTEQAKAAAAKPVPAKPRTLIEQIEGVLRSQGILSEKAIARTLGVLPTKIADEMRKLGREHKAYNIGSEDHPRWCWVIGDKSSPADLNAQVLLLTSAAPLTFQQLEAATGARRGRVSGAIVAMQRNPKIRQRIENLGNGRVFVWFVRPDKRER